MAAKRRYLVITEKFPPRKGGSNIWFDTVYRRIGDHRTHIMTGAQPDAGEHDREHPNTIHRLSLGRHPWLRPESLAIYAKLFLKAISLSRRHRFDAIHCGRVLSEGLVGLVIARLRALPLVIYAHGEEITTWRQPVKLKVMRSVYRRADRIIANSDFTREELLKLGVDPERITMIFPGVDLERFRPGLDFTDLRSTTGIPTRSRLILSVGRLTRRKGFDYVIRSLPGLVTDGIDVHYAIIGVGEDADFLAALARRFGVEQRVHLLGHVPAVDLPRWYNASDLLVMPNRVVNNDTEGFGMVFLEAAACGKPAIAGIAGGTGAAVISGVTGLRVDGDSLEAVTSALKKLLSNAPLARTLAENAYLRARREFGWEQVASKTAQLTEELLAKKNVPLRSRERRAAKEASAEAVRPRTMRNRAP